MDSAGVSIEENAVDYLSTICDGDARTALNCLEIAISKHESEGLCTDNVTRFGEISPLGQNFKNSLAVS